MQPFRFNPRSVVDALDGGQVQPGGCSALTNLVFDRVNPATLECRPAATEEYDFAGITTPTHVSIAYVVGDICYGFIGSAAVATYDQPFAYNLATSTLITVTGTQDSTTLPLTQGTTGMWAPPTMALVGVLLYVTHPGFTGGATAYFGWFDTTDPTAPVWHAGNTTTTLLPTVPTAVAQFNNRAWLACDNVLYFTDALTTTISDATHILTIGDSIGITAIAPQPLITTVQGIIQSLCVMKPAIVGLITGDAVDGTLAINIISSSVGTSAPRTVAPTPKGLVFMAEDGIRLLGQDGVLGSPYGEFKVPFTEALTPSRASAAYNNGIYRITVQNGHKNGNPYEEYWLDLMAGGWTGPHTFVQDVVYPYEDTFVAFWKDTAPALHISDVTQSGSSTFTEDGSALTFLYRTAPLSDGGGMYEGSACLSVVDMQLPHVAQSYTFVASDVNHGVISTAAVATSLTGAVWNGFNWSEATWTSVSYGMERYNIQWTEPLVFSRLVIQATGTAIAGFKIGKLVVGNEPLKYVRKL